MTSRFSWLAALALATFAFDGAVARAQNDVPGSAGDAPPRTVGSSSPRTGHTRSLDSVEGDTRSLDAAESGTRSPDAVDTGATNDPDAVPAAPETAPGDADTAPLRMRNPARPYANPAPKPATPPVPAPGCIDHTICINALAIPTNESPPPSLASQISDAAMYDGGPTLGGGDPQ